MSDHYELLISKLQDFISKFYLQQWVKGLLQIGFIFLVSFLIASTLEYNLYFSPPIRKAIFYIFTLGLFGLVFKWIIIPLYNFLSSQQRLDNKHAAKIIGDHFPEVSDKLLNVLLLRDMNSPTYSLELINASIQQKSKSLVFVKFNEAIDWAWIIRLAKYIAIPILILLSLLILFPNLIQDSTYRLMHFNQTFSPKAPFKFRLISQNLKVAQFEDLLIQAKLEGTSLPDELKIYYQGVHYPMKLENGIYTYTLKNIEKKDEFQFESLGFYSKPYQIDLIPKPLISEFEISIHPPSYTSVKSSTQKNIGDIHTLENSTAIWKFNTTHVDDIFLSYNQKKYQAEKYSNGFGLKLNLNQSGNYTVYFKNNSSQIQDSQSYSISVIADAYPTISVNEFNDSIQEILYYAGEIGDDYRLSSLDLIVSDATIVKKQSIPISKSKNENFQISTQAILKNFPKGSSVSYYFEVKDNQEKTTKSITFQLKKLTEKEIEKKVDNQTSQIQNQLSQAIKESKQFQKELDEIKKKMLEKQKLDFNDKKQLEELAKKQKELQEKLEQSKDAIQRNYEKKNELNPQEKDILDQQKHLEEMIEQMKNPELQNLLKKIEELMAKDDKKELMNQVEKMDMSSKKIEKNMDRLLQLYKQLDYKQKLNDVIDQLDKLGTDQKKLALESELKKNNLEKQKELNKELKDAQKKLEEVSKLNSELNKSEKKEFDQIKEDLESAAKEQEKAEAELEKNDTDDGAEDQKEASDKINDAKKKLDALKNKQKKKQKAEDTKMMRRLLENIIYLSFEQEKIVEQTKSANIQSPSYTNIIRHQQKLKEDFTMIEDTIYKLASRQVKVKKMIFEEVDKINHNTQLSIQNLVARRPYPAISNEQYTMTSYNRLGLMISESLKNMEEEEENESESSGQCDNPKPGKKKSKKMSLKKLAEMQEQLNDQMEKLQEKMKSKSPGKSSGEGSTKPGSSPGKEKGQIPGNKPGQAEGNSSQGQNGKESEEFAKIAAQQQAIRNALKQIEESGNKPDKSGKKPLGGGLSDLIEKMNETEKDLVNKRLYDDMLRRQKEIQIKLMESSKAEIEQDEEMKRESEQAKNIKPELPNSLKQYIENKKTHEKQIERKAIGLSPYFKTLSEKYFEMIK